MNLIIAVPMADVGSMRAQLHDVREDGAIGPEVPMDATLTDFDAQEFITTSPESLAIRYAVPAIAILQNKLRERGF